MSEGALNASEIARYLSGTEDLVDAVATAALLVPGKASGVVVVLVEGTRRCGAAPSTEEVTALVRWLRSTESDFYVDGSVSPAASGGVLTELATSLLAVAIAPGIGEYILWFRAVGAMWLDSEIDAARSLRGLVLGEMRRRATRLYEENRRLSDELRAKDGFIAAIGHELRNPLNVVNGWLAHLRSGALGADQRERAMDVLARNVRIQSELVEDLLDSSRAAHGQLALDHEPVDLAPLLEESLDSSAPALKANSLTLERDIAPELGRIWADAGRLRQILANLLTNAIKFTPASGRIRVCARRVAGGIELSIADTGAGIAPDFLPHVFEAFRQGASRRQRSLGLGLGLHIVKHLVELHGGSVAAESAGPGRGATFRVFLPEGAQPSGRSC